MIEGLVIEPMSEEFILWRCLHGGPLSNDNINRWSSTDILPFERYCSRNKPLLIKLTQTYGACAILARDGDHIVGQLRFYPESVCGMEGSGGLCLMQDPPGGPLETFVESDFPELDQIEDKTLVVHCLMTGSSMQKENPYQRKGIGSSMVSALIEWAKTNGWERIKADAFEDLPIIYECTGSAGFTFWQKLGFQILDRHPHPELQDRNQFSEFISTLEEQAKPMGITPERAVDRIVMQLRLQ